MSEQLDAVSSVLASVPAPTLPDAFESRIAAALTAEAATRAARAGAGSTAGASTAAAAAEHAVGAGSAERIGSHRRPRPARERRQLSLRLHPAMGAALLIVFLVVGFGYLVSRSNGSSSSSSSSALSEGAPANAATAAPSAPASGAAGSAALPEPSASAPDSRTALKGPVSPFTVITRDRNYRAAGLAAQVQGEVHQMRALDGSGTAGSPVPSAQSSSSYAASKSGGAVPSPAFIGCVQHLAGSSPLDLVERASYQGTPVYVIATASRAWIVGLTCTADNPGVIATVTLSAAP